MTGGPGGRQSLFNYALDHFDSTNEREIGAILAIVFSADDGCDVGEDSGAPVSPVSPDYKPGANHFNGRVKGVLLSIAEDKGEHVVDPATAIQLALARQ